MPTNNDWQLRHTPEEMLQRSRHEKALVRVTYNTVDNRHEVFAGAAARFIAPWDFSGEEIVAIADAVTWVDRDSAWWVSDAYTTYRYWWSEPPGTVPEEVMDFLRRVHLAAVATRLLR